jgi:hypothetical protein
MPPQWPTSRRRGKQENNEMISFHNTLDVARGYQINTSAGWVLGNYVTVLNRSLTYQFFPHFHPYVLDLVKRLNNGGLPALQDADTACVSQSEDGSSLAVLPDSSRATLAHNITATRAGDGTAVALTAGTPVTLADGTRLSIDAGTVVSSVDGTVSTLTTGVTAPLPGCLPAASASGIQWNIAGTDTIIPDGTLVKLTAPGATATLVNDGSTVTLPANTALFIRRGLPQPVYYQDIFSQTAYNPTAAVTKPYPVKNLDFTESGAYAIYNWETFFHGPLLMAIHLSQNQKYQDAQNWFHYIFNPTDNSRGPTPERFWRVAPFQNTDVKTIENILVNLSTKQDPALFNATIASIDDWKRNPFQPFVIAKHRPTAYMLKTVMAYLDNLIAWGDSLFAQYTIETINEAAQLYVLAANILGSKPQPVPKKGSSKPLTYNDLRGKLNAFGDALADMEADIPFDNAPLPDAGTPPSGSQILAGIGQSLYFCVPRNDKLLGYWDTVADRLFKIHNSLNLQGVFQLPPLFDPPIDPALLVRATAAGLDVSAVVSGLNQPTPLVRFETLAAKATEICQIVISLSNQLLSAIEKQDGESMALMRAQHENTLNTLNEMVKYAQWQNAIKAREGLQQSLANSIERYSYFQTMLGRSPADIASALPQLDSLDLGSLQNLDFQSNEPVMPFSPVDPDIAGDSTSVSDGGIKTLSKHEVEELNKINWAHDAQIAAAGLEAVGSGLATLPQFGAHATPIGVGLATGFGGRQLQAIMQGMAAIARGTAEELTYEATKAGKLGSYARRELDWISQSNNAAGEINLVLKQLRGAQIQEAIAQKDYENHQQAMKQAQDVVDFLQGNTIAGFQPKETTAGFYTLMKRQVKALQQKAFQIAFNLARKAERALQYELGDPSLSFIQYNYLDGAESLLAGEQLLLDVKTMEIARQDLNQREFELTKQVSLQQMAPLALVQLRATGACNFTLPEELFDLDGPGHYFRRVLDVAVTAPAVVGPYSSLSFTLTLQKGSIRTSTDIGDGYARTGADDRRFTDDYSAVQQIVTSTGQMDAGVVELRPDDRLRPFERAGVSGSQWQLSLPAEVRQFDFNTLADVILRIRYTARQGGDMLRAAAVQNLQSQIDAAKTVGSIRLFSFRHEFPSEWAKFSNTAISATAPTAQLQLPLRPEHYPFWAQDMGGAIKLKSVELFAQYTPGTAPVSVNIYDAANKSTPLDALNANPSLGGLLDGKLVKIALPSAITDTTHPPLTIYLDNNGMDQLWIAITWGK